jgi:hypothetical protein
MCLYVDGRKASKTRKQDAEPKASPIARLPAFLPSYRRISFIACVWSGEPAFAHIPLSLKCGADLSLFICFVNH